MASWLQNLTYIFRRLSRSPVFVAAAVVSIALGIAANATVFAMVSRFLLRPPPVGDPAALVTLHETDHGPCCNHFSAPILNDLREQAQSFSGIAGYYELVPASIGGSGEPERVWGQAATANYFDVAQTGMALGRGFAHDEENLPVIVLGYRLWTRRFSADPDIMGKSITLSGRSFTVVGVAPASFHGLDAILDSEFWVPLGNLPRLVPNVPDANSRSYHWLAVIARLKPGITRAQAATELNLLAQRFAKAYPATDKDNGFIFEAAGSLPPRSRPAVVGFLVALSAVVFLVLCIACANVANLLLTRGMSRQKEMAVRLALGATRGQLGREMLMESVFLGLAGGALGFILSLWANQALAAFHLPAPVPLDITLDADWRVLLYAFALSLGAGMLFGLAPAWASSRPILVPALKGEDALARPGRRWNLRNILVVSQIAMSVVLLCATGLFLRSLQGAAGIDTGFRSNGILMMSVDPQLHGYTAERTTQLLREWRDRVAAMPGVISAAVTDSAPLSGGHRSDGFVAEGRPKTANPPSTELYMVTPGYFDTMGIARVTGRDFANESVAGPKVAVVNQVFAQQLFGGSNPIGQSVSGGGVTYQIIGVVGNIKARTLGEDLRPVLFRSLDQSVAGDPSMTGYSLLVRHSGASPTLAHDVRDALRALDPTLAIFNTQTMEEHLRDALFLPRLAATLFGVFGLIGLALAGVGLFGVMSYSVTRRTREIGIRLALGAEIAAVQQLVIRQGMVLTLIALAIGLPAAFAVARFSTSLLYGVHPHDAATFTAVPLFLAAVAFLACWLPARRAAKVEPQTILRYE